MTITTPHSSAPRQYVIVGGVAGGASCAARLRRLDENARIIMVERGPYISFANCGLPYHIGGVIEDRDSLVVQTPEKFQARYGVEVRTLTEASSIDPGAQRVTLRDLSTGNEEILSYDALVLSPGASPFLPPIPGINSPGIHSLRTIPDMDRIIQACADDAPRHITVIGAGFIGLEVAENLIHRGIETTIIEMGSQVMPGLDREVATALARTCRENGIDLRLATTLTAIESSSEGLIAHTDHGTLSTDLIVVAVGVRPESQLARDAGLDLTPRSAIAVDAGLRTSDPHIYAIGDVIDVPHRITGKSQPMPLAGPANRQGRLVADNIAGLDRTYRGAQGTSIIKLFDTVAACTGISEKLARRDAIPHAVAWIHGPSHASYYPGAETLTLKAIFDPTTGRILGAQGFGKDGVDKRIDVLATAVTAGMTVFQLEELDLCYAPPFSSAKDPVNHLGAVAAGMIQKSHPTISVEELAESGSQPLLIDVRTPEESKQGSIPGALSIPLDSLREHLPNLPADRPLVTFCKEGLRGYLAARILMQHDFDVRNLLGGYQLWALLQED